MQNSTPRLFLLVALAVIATPVGALQAAEALRYDCSLMAQDIGAPVNDMVAGPDLGWQIGADEARLICTWHSHPSAKAAQGQQLSREEYKDVGALSGQVVVYDNPITRADATLLNAAVDLPADTDLPGAWLLSMKKVDLNAKLGVLPPEVIFDGVGVSVAYANSFATTTGTGSALTVGWSVGAAARIMAAAAAGR